MKLNGPIARLWPESELVSELVALRGSEWFDSLRWVAFKFRRCHTYL